MIRAVLDTNIYVSALFWRGAPYQVMQHGLRGAFTIVSSPEILKEVRNTLENKFKFPPADTTAFIEVITIGSEIVVPTVRLQAVSQDPSDNKIIECAVAGNAAYIVSGDRHLLDIKEYKGIKIATTRKYLDLL